MNWFTRPHWLNGQLSNVQTRAKKLPQWIALGLGLGLGMQGCNMTPGWIEKSKLESAEKRMRMVNVGAVRPLCISHAESDFRQGVEIYLDSWSRRSNDGSTLFWGFVANTLNGFDIPVSYRGVCVAESDGRGGVKIHIADLEPD